MKHPTRLLLAAATLVAASSANAADYWLDTNGTMAGYDGTGVNPTITSAGAFWDLRGTGTDTGTDALVGPSFAATNNYFFNLSANSSLFLKDLNAQVGSLSFGSTAGTITFTNSGSATMDSSITLNATAGVTVASTASVIWGATGRNYSSFLDLGTNQTWNIAGSMTFADATGATSLTKSGIRGAFSIEKTGTGTLTLNNSNTYSGGTIISHSGSAGSGIVVGNAEALGTGSVLVNGGQSFNHSISVSAGITVDNALTLKRGNGGSNRAILGLAASSTWSGDITVDNTSGSGLAVIAAGGTDAASASIVSGNIGFSTLGTGPALVLRSGHGKVSGSISLSTGTLQILDASNWELSNASNTWGTLDISNAGAIATVGATNTLASGGVVSSTAGGTLRLNNQAGTTAYNQTIAGLNGTVKVGLTTGAATLTLNTSADQSSSGAITGAIALVKSGAAVQTLSGANAYTGGTSVNAGKLVTGNTSALGSGAVTLGGGTLQLGATGITGIASLTVNTGTLDTTAGGVTTTGAFSLTGGTWLVGGTVDGLTATGGFNLSGGTIDLGLLSLFDKQNSGFSLISGTGTVSGLSFSNGDSGFTYALDTNGDLLVTSAVPEPSTYGLIGAGALAAVAMVRRRRKLAGKA